MAYPIQDPHPTPEQIAAMSSPLMNPWHIRQLEHQIGNQVRRSQLGMSRNPWQIEKQGLYGTVQQQPSAPVASDPDAYDLGDMIFIVLQFLLDVVLFPLRLVGIRKQNKTGLLLAQYCREDSPLYHMWNWMPAVVVIGFAVGLLSNIFYDFNAVEEIRALWADLQTYISNL